MKKAPCALIFFVTHLSHLRAVATNSSELYLEIDTHSPGDEVSPLQNGCHFSTLNHQLFVLQAQLITDESFEQVLNLDQKHPEYAGNGWAYLQDGGGVDLNIDGESAFNGEVFARLSPAVASDRPSTVSRVGMVNRGLYHEGYVFEGDRDYKGYAYARCVSATDVVFTLEDDPEPPTASTELARSTARCPGGSVWTRLNFSLTPSSSSSSCVPFPTNTTPIWCPANLEEGPGGGCFRCGGQFVVSLSDVTSDGPVVDLDMVHLAPGSWGLYFGNGDVTSARKEPVEALLRTGAQTLRYGGTFAWQDGYLWKTFRGPPELRAPYIAYHDPVYGASRGFGFFEILAVCGAAELTCVITMNLLETPSDLADLVEYALGDPISTTWGQLRKQDGREAPYPLTHVQIGNEQYIEDLVGTFVAAAGAMEERSEVLGLGGSLKYVLGSCRASNGPALIDDPNTTVLIDEIKNAGLCGQSVFDWHVQPKTLLLDHDAVDPYSVLEMASLLESRDCSAAKIAVLEENWCTSDFSRALADAASSSALVQAASIVTMRTTSQCWSAAGHAEGCTEGHILVAPNMTVLQPGAWSQRMIAGGAEAEELAAMWVSGGEGLNLSVVALNGDDGQVEIRLVNPSSLTVVAWVNFTEQPHPTSSTGGGGRVRRHEDGDGEEEEHQRVIVIDRLTLRSPLSESTDFDIMDPSTTGRNILSDPYLIHEERTAEIWRSDESSSSSAFEPLLFEPFSFTILRFKR